MNQIHVLDKETIDKIAAGEVVERPASVVKELVENAIDAGATSITVEIKDGGISFMRITDNGSGIAKEQIRTAFLRHATSKIESAEDLSRIASLGFRGEALSSIAAVAQVELITKTADSLTGTRIQIEGGEEKAFEEVGAPDGTTFLIRNLFFNTPVRRKFLKQPPTEGGYIVDLMEHMALSRPDISFKFIVGSQTKFYTSGNGELKEVIYRIYGRDISSQVIPIDFEEEGFQIKGYLGSPALVRSNRNHEIYFLNGRFIRSQVLSKAIEEGYSEYLMQHKFPLCVLHITVEDKSQVDVNVHPTKMEVRFSDGPAVYQLISKAIRACLKNKEMIPETTLPEAKRPLPGKVTSTAQQKGSQSGAMRSIAGTSMQQQQVLSPSDKMVTGAVKVAAADMEAGSMPVRLSTLGTESDNSANGKMSGSQTSAPIRPFMSGSNSYAGASGNRPSSKTGSGFHYGIKELEIMTATLSECENPPKEPEVEVKPPKFSVPEPFETKRTEQFKVMEEMRYEADRTQMADFKQETLFETKVLVEENRMKYRIIGQVFDTYWMVQFEDKLYIIDQHAAHEKVKYERFMKQYHEKNMVTQNLMPPIIVSLTGAEESVLKEYEDTFLALGFEVESFGGNEYALRAVPVDLYGCNEKQMFLEVLDELADMGPRESLKVVEEKIASMSCKAAVKGNNTLSRAEADKLIDELLTLEKPYNCPHGRPTIITMSKYEMEKRFKR
ncbi:MAG: DNA mismatch repair endonuclease MutL [Lachnospiraceae bacterium]|nr:DNA mismatch repair endonuclease MutL [Lachnospiraceae bacterium]